MHDPVLMAQIIGGAGFVAALDQSGGSTPTALTNYGISAHDYSGEEEMFALIHQMRSRLMTAPSFDGRKILGAILFEKTMDGEVDGTPVPDLLRQRGIVPFVQVRSATHRSSCDDRWVPRRRQFRCRHRPLARARGYRDGMVFRTK